jgi:hypothetical protein
MTDNVVSLARRRGRPVPGAYAEARMGQQCPNCRAAAGDWCRHPDGYTRHCPCVKRLRNNNQPRQPKQRIESVRDFSEPLKGDWR